MFGDLPPPPTPRCWIGETDTHQKPCLVSPLLRMVKLKGGKMGQAMLLALRVYVMSITFTAQQLDVIASRSKVALAAILMAWKSTVFVNYITLKTSISSLTDNLGNALEKQQHSVKQNKSDQIRN